MDNESSGKFMGVKKPFYRNFRMPLDEKYGDSGSAGYVSHESYAKSPDHYVKAYLLILKDLQGLFGYIEPDSVNKGCYSFRIHELFIRTCVEVEANFKAILNENGYKKENWLNMSDYKKVNTTQKLSKYKVELPFRYNESSEDWIKRAPFSAWDEKNDKLVWYEDYHAVKHDRHNEFKKANLGNLIEAVCGLLVLLSSQFYTEDFLGISNLALEESNLTIGGYFRVIFPEASDWPKKERYNFEWNDLKNEENIFEQYNYNA